MSEIRCSKSHCPCTRDLCPLSSAMSIIGGKWKIQIICSLYGEGAVRFNELKRRLPGVSNTVLTSVLKELEADGLVLRRQYLEMPPRVEYMAAGACEDLIPILKTLAAWGLKHRNGPNEEGRPVRTDRRRPAGGIFPE